MFLRECQREEERLEAKRLKLARGLRRDGGKAVEEEAARGVEAKRPSFPKAKKATNKGKNNNPSSRRRSEPRRSVGACRPSRRSRTRRARWSPGRAG